MSKKHKKICRVLNYTEHLLILVSTVTGCVSISGFDSLVGTSVGITSSAVGLKNCGITAGFKKYNKYKLIIKKKKKKHDEIVLLAKSKLNTIEVLISQASIDSNISHDKVVSINNVLKAYDDREEEVKNLKT